MCGIAGYLGKELIPIEKIKATINSLDHRGPDNNQFYIYSKHINNICLIHNRLSILDLEERSNQPFHFENYILVFNGEIFNYIEIKEILTKLGHHFHTESDTEVLAHALFEWGDQALEKLEGMWAFAWFNKNTNDLFLSRDRFGEKPLYFLNTKEGIYFASEIKAIIALSGLKLDLNMQHIFRYLVNGYKSINKVNEEYYKGIKRIEPGTINKIDKDFNLNTLRYWNPEYVIDNKISYQDAVSNVKEILINAVKIRMRSDVPIAFCMSGGIDSNSLISIAKNVLGYGVHGFTIVNTDKRYEEYELIKESVDYLDIKHTELYLDKTNFLENLTEQIASHDSPISTISYYLHWQLMKKINEYGFKVTISGTGADEIFTGYYDHHNLYLNEVFNDKEIFDEALNNWQKYLSPIVRNPFLKDPFLYIKDKNIRDHIFLNNKFFSETLKKPWLEEFKETNFTESLLRNRMLNELFEEAIPVILKEDDMNAMYYSIENRSPFLDSKLFEYAYTIPSKFLIKDGKAKSILRSAMEGIASQKILDSRRKVGFNAPLDDLLDLKNKEIYELILDQSEIYNYVKKDEIEKLINLEKMPNSISKFLFNFLNIKIFISLQEQ